MSREVKLNTTGTVSTIIFYDLGERTVTHPTVDLNMLLEFTLDDLSSSNDLQNAIDNGSIILKDEDSVILESIEQLNIKYNHDASVNPNSSNDKNDGYSTNSTWLNKSSNEYWICIDNAIGNAIWKKPVTVAGIDIKDEGISIPNTPHTSINFIGDSVVATDGSSGVANITISGTQGFQGKIGIQGYQGNIGVQGFRGFQGFQGWQGSVGKIGFQGWQGPISDTVTNASVQIRRTTAFEFPLSYDDISFDITDIESDSSVLQHDDSNTDRILIKEDGYYKISYNCSVDVDSSGTYNARVRKNDTVVISGSERFVADGGDTLDMGSDFISYLESGDFISMQGDKDGGSASLEPDIVLTIHKLDGVKGIQGPQGTNPGVQGPQGPVSNFDCERFDAYDSIGGTSLSTSWVDVPLDTERQKTSDFTHASSSAEIEINRDDNYYIIARTSIEQVSGNSRSEAEMRIVLNTGSGYTEVWGTRSFIYSRQNSQGKGTSNSPAILSLSSGDKIKIQIRQTRGSGDLELVEDGSCLVIYKARGTTGVQGPQGTNPGEDGADGVQGPQGPSVGTFGSEFDEVSDNTESSTTSTSYQQKLRLSTASIPAGKYRIGWRYSWSGSSSSLDFRAQIELDDTTQLMYHSQEPKDPGTDQSHQTCGFVYVTFNSSGSHTIDLDYRAENSSGRAYIRDTWIEIWRVS